VSLSDLLKRSLNLANSLALKVLDLFQSSPDEAEGLGVDSSGGQQLVDLSVLSFKGLLDGLMLLFEDEVLDSSLLVNFIDETMELFEQLLLLLLEVLELLETHFILPLNLLGSFIEVSNGSLSLLQLLHDFIMLLLLFLEFIHLFIGLGQGLDDLVVFLLLVHLLLLLVTVLLLSISKLILQLLDDIEVGVGDVIVEDLNSSIFVSVLLRQLTDSSVLLFLNLLDFVLPLVLHLLSEVEHLMLVLEVDLVADSLELLAELRLLLVLLLVQGVEVLVVADLLLLGGNLD